ncbi:MAG: response regulator [Anaerolineales bacterium]|nr:response regulator [Anaerolineales bacterium]MCA9929646.1 response regulator [Anaerolineales bacterium]
MSENHNGAQIFIVEDDLDLSEMLSAYFRVQGYEVTQATRGEEAVSLITRDVPDLIVLDIRLPDIDGYEICRRLRKYRRTQNIPIIFLTEKREKEDKLAGLELGAVDYITKPFDIQELRLRIRNSLRRSRLSTMHNPVTGLPEGVLVLERLEKMLKRPNWGIVLAGIRGLNKFRDRFGFVATDDVSRAVTLMLANAVQESGNESDFIGHADSGDFIILTTSDRSQRLAERCLVRLQPSIQYFYPAMERQRLNELPETERLTVQVSYLSVLDHKVEDLESLQKVLARYP